MAAVLAVAVQVINVNEIPASAQHWVTVATAILAALGVAGLTNGPSQAHLSLMQRVEAVEKIVSPFLTPKVVAPPVTTVAAPVAVTDLGRSPNSNLVSVSTVAGPPLVPDPPADPVEDLGTALTGMGA